MKSFSAIAQLGWQLVLDFMMPYDMLTINDFVNYSETACILPSMTSSCNTFVQKEPGKDEQNYFVKKFVESFLQNWIAGRKLQGVP